MKLSPLFDYSQITIGQLISNRMWGGFIQKAPRNHFINVAVYHALLAYMMEHNVNVDYFIQNLFIKILYDSNKRVRTEIDCIPYSNPCLYELKNNINKEFDADLWNTMLSETTFFKLNWKMDLKRTDSKGNITFYGHLQHQ